MEVNPAVGLCYTNFEIVDGTERRIADGYSVDIRGYEEMLGGSGGPCLSTAMVRKDVLVNVGLFDPMYPGIQDYDLFLKLSRQCELAFIPSCEAAYRLHGNNTSSKYMMVYREIKNVAHKHWALAKSRDDEAAMSASRRLLRNARPTYGAQAFERARGALRNRSTKSSPFTSRVR